MLTIGYGFVGICVFVRFILFGLVILVVLVVYWSCFALQLRFDIIRFEWFLLVYLAVRF